jgi:hypothetical protein
MRADAADWRNISEVGKGFSEVADHFSPTLDAPARDRNRSSHASSLHHGVH